MLEKTILSNLILNEDYCRKVYPYLKSDYFDDTVLRKVFETASDYLEKYKIKVFGPNKLASQLEGSKIFTKKLCKEYNYSNSKIWHF